MLRVDGLEGFFWETSLVARTRAREQIQCSWRSCDRYPYATVFAAYLVGLAARNVVVAAPRLAVKLARQGGTTFLCCVRRRRAPRTPNRDRSNPEEELDGISNL